MSTRAIVLTLVLCGLYGTLACGQGRASAIRELAEYLLRKHTPKELGGLGRNALIHKIEGFALRHGDEGLEALHRVGPRAFELVENAGPHAQQAVKLMARYGDNAVWIVAKNNRLALFVKYGDDAAESMMKHGEIVEPFLEAFGKSAARAFNAINGQNARRLAMMQQSGDLARIGRTSELLEVVGRYGDRAADFIWKHKGALAVSAALAAFLADPEPFLDGIKDITKVVAENAVRPLAEAPAQVAVEAARRVNWTAVALAGLALIGLLVVLARGMKLRSRREKSSEQLANQQNRLNQELTPHA